MLIFACTDKQSSTEPNPDELTSEVFADIMADAGMLEPTAAEKDVILETWDEEDQGFRYTYEKHDAVDNLENVTYLGLNDDVIWPGSMVRGEKASGAMGPSSSPATRCSESIRSRSCRRISRSGSSW
jgi:hypothetical protein